MPRLGRMLGAPLATLAGLALTGSALSAGAPPASATPVPAPIGKITWKACPDYPKARCGKLSVPVDWANPGRGTVKIAVARVSALKPKQRLGVLFVNPGGPGESGVDFALESGLSRKLRERFDIIGFDPRGVARSQAVRCGGKLGKQPSAYPRNPRDFRSLRDYQGRLHKACRAKTGLLYDFLDAGNVARDMDAIRATLGAPKLNYLGVSYGTWLGQRYAELFPGRLRAMALDSNMDHSAVGAQRFSVAEARGLGAAFGQFAKWCRTSKGKLCAVRTKGSYKVLDALMKRAEQGKLHEIGNPRSRLSPENVAMMVHVSMYNPISWPGLSEELAELNRQRPRKLTRQAAAVDGVFPSVLCADWSFPIRNYHELAQVRRATRAAAPHVRISPLGWDALISCLGRPTPSRDKQRPYEIKGAPPILLTNSKSDPATSLPWAVNTARQIPGSVLLTYDGAGHGTYGLSRCSRQAIDTYLLTARTPRPGTHCPAQPPVFNAGKTRSPAIGRPPRF